MCDKTWYCVTVNRILIQWCNCHLKNGGLLQSLKRVYCCHEKSLKFCKTCLKGPLKKSTKNLFFNTNYSLMQVKSIAECSKRSILQYFRPSFSYHFSIKTFVLSIFKWPLKTGFTPQCLLFCRLYIYHNCVSNPGFIRIRPSVITNSFICDASQGIIYQYVYKYKAFINFPVLQTSSFCLLLFSEFLLMVLVY